MSRGYKDTSTEDGYVITSGRVAKGLTIQDALSLEEIEASTEEMLGNKVAKAQALKDVNNNLTDKIGNIQIRKIITTYASYSLASGGNKYLPLDFTSYGFIKPPIVIIAGMSWGVGYLESVTTTGATCVLLNTCNSTRTTSITFHLVELM